MVAQAPDGGALVDRRVRADGARDDPADDRLGDHLAVDAPPGAGRHGRAGRPGGRGSRSLPARLRHVEDLPEQHQGSDAQDARPHARCGRDRAGRPLRRCVLVRRRHVERRRAGAVGGGAHAARRAARLRRRHRAEDAGPRRRDRRRVPHAVDHDAGVRPVHVRQRRRGHRHRLHRRRLDPSDRPGRRARRRPGDRRDVPREQGPEHRGRGRHAARPRRNRDGRDQAGRGGDGARREACRQGSGIGRPPRQVQADRGHTGGLHRSDRGVPRRGLHARDARALGRATATSRSASSARKCCRTSAARRSRARGRADDRPRPPRRDGEPHGRHVELHGQRAGDGRAHARPLRRDGVALPVAAGRGGPRERARDLGRRGRRQEPHVQRPHGHVVLGTRAVARARAGLPARGVRPRRTGSTGSASRT